MVLRLMAIAILFVLLTACSSGMQPSKKLVQSAIALQLEQTQQQLSKQLGVDFQGLKVEHIKIEQREPTEIQSLPSYHVRGTYDLTLKLPHTLTQKQNAFDVYLQRQQEGKTWRLLIPQKDPSTWLSYLIR
ncbi:hypothetical protein [Chroogloeocystis siderophila]|uniref:Lipoprotein n=1 Tax=Chroogloeocystis siderophila 5.2 s.c.1 TaxID=247279 RepID=A0A1U7HQR8_9CHRO|nr:hypothetical protein [Chroogloeocystis siderophila]OKH25932.1 hypothetical protein NIES1031_12950 [Chroogloeocystis siderophila 5.2 s.c.1]